MRYAVLAAVLAALAVPAVAQAQPCWCMKWFADNYVANNSMRVVTANEMARRGIGRGQRDRTRDAVYDYQRRGDFNSSFCRDHPRACRAALACVASAGATLLQQPSGTSYDVAMRRASLACAAAAATVWLAG